MRPSEDWIEDHCDAFEAQNKFDDEDEINEHSWDELDFYIDHDRFCSCGERLGTCYDCGDPYCALEKGATEDRCVTCESKRIMKEEAEKRR